MALDKLVDSTQLDTDLTSVANAIRTKGGTSAQLAFPAGFVSAIDAIPTGGGGNRSSGTITLAADGSITIPHNLNSLRVICLVRPTGTIKPSTGYKHMSLVAVNFLEIYADELQSVVYDFTAYNTNFPNPISRTGPYPGSVALKSPWTNRTEAQWQGYSNWEGNFGYNNGAGELKVTFNLDSIVAQNFAKGSYAWEAFTV